MNHLQHLLILLVTYSSMYNFLGFNDESDFWEENKVKHIIVAAAVHQSVVWDYLCLRFLAMNRVFSWQWRLLVLTRFRSSANKVHLIVMLFTESSLSTVDLRLQFNFVETAARLLKLRLQLLNTDGWVTLIEFVKQRQGVITDLNL